MCAGLLDRSCKVALEKEWEDEETRPRRQNTLPTADSVFMYRLARKFRGHNDNSRFGLVIHTEYWLF
jgi:hypothetical protein